MCAIKLLLSTLRHSQAPSRGEPHCVRRGSKAEGADQEHMLQNTSFRN